MDGTQACARTRACAACLSNCGRVPAARSSVFLLTLSKINREHTRNVHILHRLHTLASSSPIAIYVPLRLVPAKDMGTCTSSLRHARTAGPSRARTAAHVCRGRQCCSSAAWSPSRESRPTCRADVTCKGAFEGSLVGPTIGAGRRPDLGTVPGRHCVGATAVWPHTRRRRGRGDGVTFGRI